MKWVSCVLLAALLWFQHSLWLGKGGWRDMWQLESGLQTQLQHNQQLAHRNRALAAEVQDLSRGEDAIAEIARVELGYIQEGEIYYRFVPR